MPTWLWTLLLVLGIYALVIGGVIYAIRKWVR